MSTAKNLLEPDSLNGADASSIAPGGIQKLIIHDCFHPLTEQHARRMNGYILVAHQGFIGPIWRKTRDVGCKPLKKAFQD